MSKRYYHPELRPQAEILLEDQEASHLLKVMRAQVGDVVEIFDGKGHSTQAEIKELKKKEVLLLGAQLTNDPSPASPKLIAALAPPKGERLDLIIEKGTELGIDQFDFIRTSRSVVMPGEQKVHRLEQLAISACKQSGRNHLPILTPLTSLEDWLANKVGTNTVLLLADPAGSPWSATISRLQACESITYFIGPEGGFTSEETALLRQHGALAVSIAPHILRVETAALALAALLVAQFRHVTK